MTDRSYRVEERRDFISGFNFRVILTGPSVGGYGEMQDSFGGKFFHRAHAEKAGAIFVETGLLPAFQTDANIAERRDIIRQSEFHRVRGGMRSAA